MDGLETEICLPLFHATVSGCFQVAVLKGHFKVNLEDSS